jgi:hypothetical protein
MNRAEREAEREAKKPPKLPRAWVEVDDQVALAIEIIRAARKAQHPYIAEQFLKRDQLIREAILSVAEQLSFD